MVNPKEVYVSIRIGIAGAAGSGKTTAAKYLVDKHDFVLLGFATPLYKLGDIHTTNPEEWHSRIWGWAYDYLEPLGYSNNTLLAFTHDCLDVMENTEVIEGKNRSLLQTLGTEVGRALNENLWTDIFEAKVKELGDVNIVNDNLRFPNEFECLKRLGFKNIFMDTFDELRFARYEKEYGISMNEGQLSHASEAHLNETRLKCDYIYFNNFSIEELHKNLDDILHKEGKRKLTLPSFKMETMEHR